MIFICTLDKRKPQESFPVLIVPLESELFIWGLLTTFYFYFYICVGQDVAVILMLR